MVIQIWVNIGSINTAVCLIAPGHYLHQFWLLINEDLRHWSESNFTVNAISAPTLYTHIFILNIIFLKRIAAKSPRGHELTRWGQVMHICISKLIIIGSGNGLSPGWCQAIISTNAGILSIGTSGTKFSELLIKIHIFSFKEMYLKMSSAK